MIRLAWVASAAGLLVMAAGCYSLAPPNWGHAGTADCQQRRAEQFDPYPEKDVAPAIVGSRPMDYQNPPAEVQRSRWYLPSFLQR